MRGTEIFSGTSHPVLAEAICERLGTLPAKCSLGKFSNGETSVNIGVSVRNKDVFIVQSGSTKINDSVMELLIMIAACKGGSAKSITAVMPYFPYSRQSKKKSHRGAITARMLANLLSVAGVDHVITVDLHASQMQGFFGKPVDNLFAEPLIARWIQSNVKDWKDGVVVSKNAGGTKRVTSLADTLKLNFGIVTTDRMRNHMSTSIMDSSWFFDGPGGGFGRDPPSLDQDCEPEKLEKSDEPRRRQSQRNRPNVNGNPSPTSIPQRNFASNIPSSPLVQSTRAESTSPSRSQTRLTRATTAPAAPSPTSDEATDEYTDGRAREVVTARLFQGHIVDDNHPSPSISAMSGPATANPEDYLTDPFNNPLQDPMTSSFVSTVSSFQPEHALGGTFDAAASSDEEEDGLKNPELEQTVTLVGHVRDKTVFLVDDIIDRSTSWIAAAETVVKRGGAKQVYCVGTHGLFGDDSLEEMERCECIDYIVVTNSFPISKQKIKECKKLVVLDLANLLSEAIRRNHYGEKRALLGLMGRHPEAGIIGGLPWLTPYEEQCADE